MDNPVNDELIIKFSNNYQDTFFLSEDGLASGLNEMKSNAYAAGIKNDMYALNCVSLNTLVWNFRYVWQGEPTNIWVLFRQRSADQHYEVYGNGELLFKLAQTDNGWDLHNPAMTKAENIDNNPIKKVIKILDKEAHILQ